MEDRRKYYAPIPPRIPLLGRSLHRVFVAVPVVLFVLTLGFFVQLAATHDPSALRAALDVNVAAVVAALLAAGAGIAEGRAIPVGHPARNLVLTHALLSTIALGLFALDLFAYRHQLGSPSPAASADVGIVLSALGVAVTMVSGAVGMRMAHLYRAGQLRAGALHAVPRAGTGEIRSHG